jgi:hypothetical protein
MAHDVFISYARADKPAAHAAATARSVAPANIRLHLTVLLRAAAGGRRIKVKSTENVIYVNFAFQAGKSLLSPGGSCSTSSPWHRHESKHRSKPSRQRDYLD